MQATVSPDRRTMMEVLNYDKHTGALTWRVSRGRTAKAGDEAGFFSNGVVLVGLQGRTYTAARLIYYYVTGSWPKGRLRFRDNDSNNLRWNNIMDERSLSQRHANVYQRYRRQLRKLVLNRVANDSILLAKYQSLPLIEAKAMMRELMRNAAGDVARGRVHLHADNESELQ